MNISTVVTQNYFNGIVKESSRHSYFDLLKTYFKRIGLMAFGQLKFLTKERPFSEKDYNWKTLDNVLSFAEENEILVHYNTVVNNKSSFPTWYWNLTSSEKLSFLEVHIKTVLNRYKNRFYMYKLVNEVARDEEKNFLGTGENRADVVAKMFKWAKEEYPKAILLLNDFGNFYNREIREKYIRLINEIQDKGAKVDFIGLQGHMWTFELPSDEAILETLNSVHKQTKLPLHITEFDISYDNSLHGGITINPMGQFKTSDGRKFNNWYEYQAHAYTHFIQLCNEVDFVKEITLWGFVDENVPWERPGIGIFKENFEPKIAFNRLKNSNIL